MRQSWTAFWTWIVLIVSYSSPLAQALDGGFQQASREVAYQHVTVEGKTAYVSNFGTQGILALDVADPTHPRELWRITLPLISSSQVVNRRVFAATTYGLTIVEVTNGNPAIKTNLLAEMKPECVSVIQDRAYVGTQLRGVIVLDISNLDDIVQVGRINTIGKVSSLFIAGDRALVADSGGLAIADLRDPGVRIGYFFQGTIRAVTALGNYAYLATETHGVLIIDISDPSNPRKVGQYMVFASPRALALEDTLLYVAQSDELKPGVHVFEILDVSNPTQPRKIKGFGETGNCTSVHLSDGKAYLTAWFDGLWILDTKAPGALSLLGKYPETPAPRIPQTLQFSPPAEIVVTNSPFTLHATASSGIRTTFSLVSGPATLQGDRLLLRETGEVIVRAEQTGNVFYEPVSKEARIRIVKAQTSGAWVSPAAASLDLGRTYSLDLQTTRPGQAVTFTLVSGQGNLQGNQLTPTGGGTIVVRAEQPETAIYSGLVMERSFAVKLPRQTVAWLSPTNSFLEIGTPYALQARASSGLPVAFRLKSGPAILTGTTVVATNLGAVEVVAEQSGSEIVGPARFTRTFNRSEFHVGGIGIWSELAGGEATALKVVGQYAYVVGRGLQVFDVSDPKNAKLLAVYNASASARAVEVVGNLAYVISFTDIDVVDISNPAAPVGVLSYYMRGFANGITIDGNYAYLPGSDFESNQGLHILDISEPARPSPIAFYRVPGEFVTTHDVAVEANRAYLTASNAGLLILDVKEPRNPTLLGSYNVPNAHGIRVAGNLAYVANQFGGMQVVDVSDPTKPGNLGSYNTSGSAVDVDLRGNFAYVADDTAGVQQIDVSNPSAPARIGGFNTRGRAEALQVQDRFLYLADGEQGLQIFELSATGTLEPAWINESPGEAKDVQVAGNYAYVASSVGGLRIVDVSDPARPIRVGKHRTYGSADVIRIEGTKAYVGAEELEILDITRPESPVLLSSVYVGSQIYDIAIHGNLAYVAVGTGGISVVDVSDSQNPRWLTSFGDQRTFNYGVAIQEGFAYIATSSRVDIFDISNLDNPRRVGVWANPGFGNRIKVAGDYAFAANSEEGVTVLDVRDPTSPVRVSGGGDESSAAFIHVSGSTIYLANPFRGLRALDVTDPLRPSVLADFPTVANASSAYAVGDKAYVACGAEGMQIVRFREGWRQRVDFFAQREMWISDLPLPLVAKASSGLPISFSVVQGQARIEGDRVLPTGPGIIQIRATQAGDTNYLPATADRFITVKLNAQKLSLTSPSTPLLNLSEAYPVAAQSDSGLPVNIELKGGPAIYDGTNIIITNIGAVVLRATQAGDTNHAPVQEDFALNTPRVSLTEAGSWPGYSRGDASAVRVSGQRAFVSTQTGGIMIFDLSDPANPRRLGSINSDAQNNVSDLEIVGNLAYVSDGTALSIVDVTDPSAPVEIGDFKTADTLWRMEISDGLAYFAAPGGTFHVVDVKDPRNPKGSSRTKIGQICNDIAVGDGIAVLAEGRNGIVIVDLHDPSHPFPIATYNIGGYSYKVRLQNGLAFVSQQGDGFSIIDVSDPGLPREVGRYSQSSAEDLVVIGDVALLTGYEDIVQVVDLSDLARPAARGNIRVPGVTTSGIAMLGTHALVAARQGGVFVVNATNYPLPALTARYDTAGIASDLDVIENKVYLADGLNGLQIIDVTDPAKPERMGNFRESTAKGIVVSDGVALIGAGPNGVKSYKVANPENPTLLSQAAIQGNATRMAISSNLLLIASGDNGLQLADVSNPTNLLRLGGLQPGGSAYAVDAAGAFAFVATSSALRIVNVADPGAPKNSGAVSSPGPVYDVQAAGTLAYLANGGNGLSVVDISDPTKPRSLNSLVTGGTSSGIEVVNGIVYLADGSSGVSIIDARDPMNLAVMGRFPRADAAQRVRVVGNRAYVAAGSKGLKIFDVRIAMPQSITVSLPARLALREEAYSVNATASSSLPVVITLVSGPATLNGGQLQVTGLGTLTLKLEQAGNDGFLPAIVQQTIEVIQDDADSVVSSWIARLHPSIPEDQRTPLADPDRDGVPNILECLLSTDPGSTAVGDGRLATGRIVERDGQKWWEISVQLNAESALTIPWFFETSTALDPAGWQPVQAPNLEQTGNGTIMRFPLSETAKFVRLRIQR